jgi:cysteine synthase
MILHDVTHAIGHTPLVRLSRLAPEHELLGKLEYLSPGGSVKDRAALAMILDGEARGLLAPGGTIVEASGGNTGVGLAMVAAVRGYRCVIVVPQTTSGDKLKVLRALGAEVVLARADVDPEDAEGFIGRARMLAKEQGAFAPDQFGNPANAGAHYRTTGPEIVADCEGQLDAFVCCVGSHGTLGGIGRYLREHVPRVHIAAVVTQDDSGIEGVGAEHNADKFMPDEVLRLSDAEAFAMQDALVRREGILAGFSSGLAVAAAKQVAARFRRVVVILPDTARNYLSA